MRANECCGFELWNALKRAERGADENKWLKRVVCVSLRRVHDYSASLCIRIFLVRTSLPLLLA